MESESVLLVERNNSGKEHPEVLTCLLACWLTPHWPVACSRWSPTGSQRWLCLFIFVYIQVNHVIKPHDLHTHLLQLPNYCSLLSCSETLLGATETRWNRIFFGAENILIMLHIKARKFHFMQRYNYEKISSGLQHKCEKKNASSRHHRAQDEVTWHSENFCGGDFLLPQTWGDSFLQPARQTVQYESV